MALYCTRFAFLAPEVGKILDCLCPKVDSFEVVWVDVSRFVEALKLSILLVAPRWHCTGNYVGLLRGGRGMQVVASWRV
jgi:hypothetical protein